MAVDLFTVEQRGAAVITRGEVAIYRDRFMRRVRVDDATGCWIWTGKPNEHGYGRFTYGPNGRIKRYAHRVAIAIFREDVPAELEANHRCRVRSCVNPDHLRLDTAAANRAAVGLSPEIGPIAQPPLADGPAYVDEIPF